MKKRTSSKILGTILACLIIASMFGATPSITYASNFGIGDTVEVYNTGSSGLLVRDTSCGDIIGGKFDGDRGVVLNGPVYCNNYNRWLIRWNGGLEGWSAEDWLRKVSQPPSPPAHISPLNGATGVSLTPTFKWSSVSNADYYGLYISEPPYGPSNLVYDSEVDYGPISGTSLPLPSGILSPGVKYYWNMRSHNAAGWGSFSSSWYFTTTPPVDNIPTVSITSPSNNQHFPYSTSGVTVQGTANDDHQVTLVQVRVNGGSWTTASGTTSWNKSINLVVGANRIEARAKDNNNQYSTVVSITVFREGQQPPPPPTLIYPGSSSAPGQEIETLTPRFQWTSVPNVDRYALRISIEPYGEPNIIYENRNILGSSAYLYLPTGKLENGKKYRWDMNSHNSAGWGPISPDLYFRVCLPNRKPTAHIDSISPNPATEGETVSFSGHGADPDGDSITAYGWRSSIDSLLSSSASFSKSDLSVGTHTIYFKVRDSHGLWSDEVAKTLTINRAPRAGSIIVSTNLDQATFTITGPTTYHGSGKSWSTSDAPAGTYTIAYGDVSGHVTPSSDTKTLIADGSITFSATYIKSRFSTGDRIRTTTHVWVRNDHRIGDNKIWLAPKESTGTIINGPKSGSGYIWWKIMYDVGIGGWSAEGDASGDFLGKYAPPHPVADAFQYPLTGTWAVSQDFGVWNSDWGGYHLAEDVLADAYTPVYASGKGKVRFTSTSISGYGSVIIIEHRLPNNSYVCSLYGHLSRNKGLKANVGDYVSKGQLIGYIGNSSENGGYVPHIHFGIRKGGYSTENDYCGKWLYVGYSRSCSGYTHAQYRDMWHDPTDFVGPPPTYCHPVLTSPLEITPVKDKYYVGDTLTARFTITNEGTAPITFDVLTVGGRFNDGKLPNGEYPDFTWSRNIVLNPSGSHQYQGSLILDEAGNYHFFCAYRTPDGNWNPSVDFGEGLTDEDRIEDIVVLLLPEGLGVEDILTVLDAYFKGEPSGLSGGKVPTVDDIFNLLDAYFSS